MRRSSVAPNGATTYPPFRRDAQLAGCAATKHLRPARSAASQIVSAVIVRASRVDSGTRSGGSVARPSYHSGAPWVPGHAPVASVAQLDGV
ncbi:MAG TPA: hypothetical protein VHK63_09525 [Candidatus Limnocylindria bacterium]|nr:hypothetical protein [Candidatus Limnocylindria bacterium]